MTRSELRRLAVLGAKARLQEIADERAALYEMFPGLRYATKPRTPMPEAQRERMRKVMRARWRAARIAQNKVAQLQQGQEQ